MESAALLEARIHTHIRNGSNHRGGNKMSMDMMTEIHDRRPLPTTPVQVAGQAVGDVTTGLNRAPLAFAFVILNVVGIGAAVYFLNLLITQNSKHMTEIVELQSGQFKGLIDMHIKEFDALLDLASRTQVAPFTTSPSTAPTPPSDRRGSR